MRQEDRQLVEAFLAGEAGAVQTVTTWIRQALGSYRRRLGADWEDTVQEVLVEAIELLRKGTFEGRSRLRTYLWRVANHTALDQLRRDRSDRMDDFEVALAQAPSPGDSPLSGLLRREQMTSLLELLHQMSSACRELWSMILEGLSYNEMSQRVGVAAGTLRVRVLRCRQRAIAALKERRDSAAGAEM